MTAPECPSCRRPMDPGFMVDRAHANSPTVTEWVQGLPERGFFGLRLRGKMRVPITTYRCARCGQLQSFAHQG